MGRQKWGLLPDRTAFIFQQSESVGIHLRGKNVLSTLSYIFDIQMLTKQNPGTRDFLAWFWKSYGPEKNPSNRKEEPKQTIQKLKPAS